jgi:hypothetical protein
LEIDHFQPRSAGGGNDFDNLIYCCPACNRHKGDFWIPDGVTTTRRLLHPRRDDVSRHLREGMDGRLIALSETGAFHRDRLRLNRPPLVVFRRRRLMIEEERHQFTVVQAEQEALRQRIANLERAFEDVLAQLARLLGP